MASIIRQFTLAAPAATVWDAVADFGELHTRLVPGFVTGTAVDGDVRTVTFANGLVVRERLVGQDPSAGGSRTRTSSTGRRTTPRRSRSPTPARGVGRRGSPTCCRTPSPSRWRR